jgi:hypothetical protein
MRTCRMWKCSSDIGSFPTLNQHAAKLHVLDVPYLPNVEVLIKHGVKDAQVQVPLQRLGQHEAAA